MPFVCTSCVFTSLEVVPFTLENSGVTNIALEFYVSAVMLSSKRHYPL